VIADPSATAVDQPDGAAAGHPLPALVDHALRRSPHGGARAPRAARRIDADAWHRLKELATGDERGLTALVVAAAALAAARRTGDQEVGVTLTLGDPPRHVRVTVRVPAQGDVRTYLRGVRDSAVDALRDDGGRGAPATSELAVTYGAAGDRKAHGVAVEAIPEQAGLRVLVIGDRAWHGSAFVGELAAEIAAILVALPDLDAELASLGRPASPALDPGPPAPTTSIVDELLRQVHATPDAIAVVFGEEALTYRELEWRSATLARRLAATHGVKPGDRVALLVAPSDRLVVAMLGVLRAGAAYVPLDDADPPERSNRMIAAAGAGLVLSDRAALDWAPPVPVAAIAPPLPSAGEAPLRLPPADALAYVMFTSGSTGGPKPVPVEHRSVVRVALGQTDGSIEPGDRVAQLATPVFDASVFEVFATLLNGAALHVAPPSVRGRVERVCDFLRAERIDVAFLTTPLLNRVVDHDAGALAGLRRIVFGGEDASVEHVARALAATGPGGRLVHAYGPTETTVFATTGTVEDVRTDDRFVPIGRAIGWTRVYVLGDDLRPLPTGVVGEIFIGGCGLSAGAPGDARFLGDPFLPGERLYRSGDLGCLLPDGALRCIGRRDDQVKIRGFRVEPGEVASALRELPGVRDAAALVRELPTGERTLDAYAAGDHVDEEALHAALARRLPAWMVPARVRGLPELPLAPNGKLDRSALRALACADEPPSLLAEGLERELAEIWTDLIGTAPRTRADDFFSVGGHSLTAARLVTEIHGRLAADLRLADVFENPTIAGQAALVARARSAPAAAATPATELPVTETQRRIWLDEEARPGGASGYLMPEAYELAGPLDPDLLADALRHLVARHDALRLTFAEVDGRLRAAPGDRTVELRRERVTAGGSLDEATYRLRQAEGATPMDLRAGPLLRATLLTGPDDRHRLLLTVHHLAADGWSLGVLVNELLALLRAGRDGFAAALPPALPYAEVMRLAIAADPTAESVQYWRDKLADGTRLELPTDRPRGARPTRAGRRLAGGLGRPRSRLVHRTARELGTTPFVVLVAALKAVLARYAGADDVTLGTPLAGRDRAALSSVVASLVRSVPLRDAVDPSSAFRTLVAAVAHTVAEARRHGPEALELALRELRVRAGGSRHPLYDVMVTMSDRTLTGLESGDEARVGDALVMRRLPAHYDVSRFDMTIWFLDGEDLGWQVEYDDALFDADRIERFMAHLRRLLDAALASPGTAIGELPLLPPEELVRIAAYGRGPRSSSHSPLPDLFAASVGRSTARPAAAAPDGELSYGELDASSARLAGALAAAGVTPGDRVGLVARPSLDTVVGLLAAWRAGAAFVPLDPTWPAARVRAVARGARCRVAIGPQLAGCEGMPALDAAASGPAAPRYRCGSEQAAYVVHTSGTSGGPKGVVVSHRAIATWVTDQAAALSLGADDTVAQPFAWTFDTAVFFAGLALATGARLVLLAPAVLADPQALCAAVNGSAVTVLGAMPSHLAGLGPPDVPCVRALITGGEAPDASFVARWTSGCRYVNQYGPTEATCCTSWQPGGRDGNRATPAAGRPLAGVTVEVHDAHGSPAPIGIPGEVVISGAGLASGYLDRRDEAGRFVARADGTRAYRTGDRGRWASDGLLEVLGRDDDQLKVRGYRVERGEVEQQLTAAPAVERAAVVEYGDGLVGFVQGDVELDPDAVLEAARRALPPYMIPARLIVLERLPVTSNGKVDRRALVRIAGERPPSPEPPAGTLEAELCALVSDQLQATVGPLDDFFEAGASSLTLARMRGAIENVLHVPLELGELFERPTVRRLLGGLAEREAAPSLPPIVRATVRDRQPASHAQRRFWLIDRIAGDTSLFNGCGVLALGRVEAAAVERALDAVVARHGALRTTISGSDGEAWQVVHEPGHVTLPVDRLAGPLYRDPGARELLRAAERSRFALERGPAWSARLLREPSGDQWLLLVLNHAVADGWSNAIVTDELQTLLVAERTGRPPAVVPRPLEYVDYAEWERHELDGPTGGELADYWHRALADLPEPLRLTGHRPAAGVTSSDGAVLTRMLPAAHAVRLDAVGRRHGASTFMTVAAGLATWAQRLTGREDFVLGFPHGGRQLAGLEHVVGPFVNPLPLRCRTSPRESFSRLLARMRVACLGAYAHALYPFDRIVQDAAPPRVPGRNPLFEVGLTWAGDERRAARGHARFEPFTTVAKQDLWFHVSRDGGLRLDVEYRSSLLDRATVESMTDRLERILVAAADDPHTPLEQLDRDRAGRAATRYSL
jgi:amino acid adenylation domain-containing protein